MAYRSRCLVLVTLLLAASATFSPARAGAPLIADAGDTTIAYNGAPLALSGRALGGVAPFTYAWSWDGDASRIANATSSNATFNASALPAQDITFTLTIEDANGATASDTVVHRIDSAPILLSRNVALTYGVPDDLVGGLGVDNRQITFNVPAGLARFDAVLDWTDGALGYDLDFELLDPTGAVVSGTQGISGAKPERITMTEPAAGGWTARILPFLNGPTTATLTIQGFPAGSLPRITTADHVRFGSMDTQHLSASVSGGEVPTSLAWDLDGDGLYEQTGTQVVAHRPPGTHAIRLRATDGNGYEVSRSATITVVEADTIVKLRCGNDPSTPYWAMEFTSTKGSCWIHGGHHTYFMDHARFGLRHLTGLIFTVEQQFSPPIEYALDDPGTTPIHLQVSENGQDWTEITIGHYQFLPDVADGSLAVQQRQYVHFDAAANGTAFRYLRVHEPLSAAQGLSGYLDHSEFDIEADILDGHPWGAAVPGDRSYDCLTGGIMEDFFVTHPCWFGGIDRYDAPSFYHTYPLGDNVTLDRVTGSATLLPWRLDDWTQGDVITNATNISLFVQTSVNGVHWTDAAQIFGTFGSPIAFDVALDSEEARFVRLFPDYHLRFDQTAQFAPNHHPKGYFVDSRINVEGLMPSL